MPALTEIERRINELDVGLFNAIISQSSPDDKRAWLALQQAKRKGNASYTYLEIGSHLGGSVQPYLMDVKCRRIYSIDPRPLEQPDDRGQRFRYEGNSTARMLENLRKIDPDQISKIICFDSDARDLDPKLISEPPDLCFIDGEHTKAAVLSDFGFCQRVCSPNAIIYFHDDNIIYPALGEILRSLTEQQIQHAAFKLGGATFAIGIGASATMNAELQKQVVKGGHDFIRQRQMRRIAKALLPPPLLRLKRLFHKSPSP